jgi:hypothetical protein
MFLALIGNAELLLLALTAALVCGGAIGWVARDCARLRRWTASETPRGPVPNFSTSRFTIVLVGSAGAEGFTQSLTIHGPQIGEGSDLSIGVTRALPRSPNVIQRAKANPGGSSIAAAA